MNNFEHTTDYKLVVLLVYIECIQVKVFCHFYWYVHEIHYFLKYYWIISYVLIHQSSLRRLSRTFQICNSLMRCRSFLHSFCRCDRFEFDLKEVVPLFSLYYLIAKKFARSIKCKKICVIFRYELAFLIVKRMLKLSIIFPLGAGKVAHPPKRPSLLSSVTTFDIFLSFGRLFVCQIGLT